MGKRVIKGDFIGATRENQWKGNLHVRYLDVRGWDMELCTAAGQKFYGYTNLVSLDTSNWNLSALVNGYMMFRECISLQTLNTSNWKLSALTNGNSMFYGCNSLQTLDFRKSTFRNVTSFSGAFDGCYLLAELWLPLTFDKLTVLDLAIPSWGSTDKGLASLRWTFGEGSDDRTAKGLQPCTVRLHANVYDRLTDNERAAAAKKGWTITK